MGDDLKVNLKPLNRGSTISINGTELTCVRRIEIEASFGELTVVRLEVVGKVELEAAGVLIEAEDVAQPRNVEARLEQVAGDVVAMVEDHERQAEAGCVADVVHSLADLKATFEAEMTQLRRQIDTALRASGI